MTRLKLTKVDTQEIIERTVARWKKNNFIKGIWFNYEQNGVEIDTQLVYSILLDKPYLEIEKELIKSFPQLNVVEGGAWFTTLRYNFIPSFISCSFCKDICLYFLDVRWDDNHLTDICYSCLEKGKLLLDKVT